MYINVLTQIGAKAVDQNYIYSVPKELISKIKVGIRVKISFGKMILEGFVTKINPDINYDKTKIKDILDIVDDTPVLNKEMLLLGKDMSNKLLCSLVSAYQVMLPKALKAEINTNIKIKYNKYLKRLKSIEEIDEYIKDCKYESQINILCKLKEGDILITKMTSSINTIIKYGRNKLYYRQIAKIILMALFFSSSFFLINLVISKGKSSVFYNWTEINSYLFYTKKYLVDINPYLLLILIWLQDFVYIVSAELLYLVLKWIFLRGKESVIIVVWLIFLVVERLTGRIIPVVNAATLHMDIVAQMFFIAVLLIGMKLLLLKRVINKRDF